MRILRQALTVVVGTALLAGCGHAGISNGAYCLWVWGSNTAFTTHYDYDLRRCPPPAT